MITYHKLTLPAGEKFSILIPSWNNLDFLKLCIESIRKNSTFAHQVIVHVNDGSDGTLDWLQKNKIDYTHSKQNVGICFALNAARTLAHTGYIAYMNDDMYALPHWDIELWRDIQGAGTDMCFFSSTMIEPYGSGNPAVIAPKDYGTDIKTFREKELLQEFSSFTHTDWSGATWPPNVVPISLWDLVGGYSTEFSPGMYSDPDFSMKLWQAGVRLFKGVAASRVYHFGSKSTLRVKKNNGYRQFVKKWGITPSILNNQYLKRGQPFTGPLPEPDENTVSGWQKLKARIKSI